MVHNLQALRTGALGLFLALAGYPTALLESAKAPNRAEESTRPAREVLWQNPVNIASRNLLYGSGGRQHEPRGPFTFMKEDLGGSNPKFEVRDKAGVRWKVKLGVEARSETAASRLLWAAGYVADEVYLLPEMKLVERPSHLRRGRDLIGQDGIVRNARLRRHIGGEEKLGRWHWKRNPFSGTRELNGLRVMMALINNWDLKDENTVILEEKRGDGPPTLLYGVRDLGASFGASGHTLTNSKDNLHSYERSAFIDKTATDYVDFNTPAFPPPITVFNIFYLHDFISRARMVSTGRHIPRADARWIGQILSRLSSSQIRDAFRGAGYSPAEVDAFARILEKRISQLKAL